MSDNDLIRRGDAKAHPFANGMYDREHADKKFISGFESYKEWLDTVPAIPHEMSAREWLMTASKICVNHKCSQCPLEDVPCIGDYASHIYTKAEARKAVTIVGKWAREHPEERSEK